MKLTGMIVVLCLLLFMPIVAAQEVHVSTYVLNLGKYEVATGSYTADFYLGLDCDEACPPINFEFMNGRATSVDKIIDQPNEKFYRIQAALSNQVDLKQFPFDEQTLTIVLEDKNSTIDQLVFVPNKDESGIDNAITFIGWHIDNWDAKADEHNYPVYDETYSRYTFSLNIEKLWFNSFLKTFLPVIFMMMVVLSSYVINPDKIATRLAMAGSTLVAAVMFHVSISNQVPPVSYLTFADKFMILTYLILLVTFIINVVMFEFQELKKEKIVMRIHQYTEYSMFALVPIAYILLFLIVL